MKKIHSLFVKSISLMLAAVLSAGAFCMPAEAVKLSEIMPAAGIGQTLSGGNSLTKIKTITEEKKTVKKSAVTSLEELTKSAAIYKRTKTCLNAAACSRIKEPDAQLMLTKVLAEKEAEKAESTKQLAELVSAGTAAQTEESEKIEAPAGLLATATASAVSANPLSLVLKGSEETEASEETTEESANQVPEETAPSLEAVLAAERPEEKTSPLVVNVPEQSAVQQAVKAPSTVEEAKITGEEMKAEAEAKEEAEKETKYEKEIKETDSVTKVTADKAASLTEEERGFRSLVIAKVNRYVNVRSDATEDSEVVGKLYDGSVGEFLEEKDGWYQITSGNVTGYVKSDYCVTGNDAIELAKEVGTRMATVTTETLNVRKEPDQESDAIGQIGQGEDLMVLEENDDWVKVTMEEGEGWISTDYVDLRTDFVKAESKEEERARLAQEAAERRRNQAAAAGNTSSKSMDKYNSASSYIQAGEGSAMGNAVAQFALQFVGNPYVYGGSSLTNGTDCSGFVMSVYANFGVSLPHSSTADRNVGAAVGSLEEAQPGDLICYSGHVALYIGGGRIVHASTRKTGIITGTANYKRILAIRRIF